MTHGFQAVAISEFVARYGTDDFELSLSALADLTRYGSAEFAIRPFLNIDPARTLAAMLEWSGHADYHVRRLASEGGRPRLPWAARVDALKKDPTLSMPILERLKTDPNLYVRKSVANHLNDIAKDRPDWLVDRLAYWPQDDPRTAWIVRHALRTLIKTGDPRALALLGVAYGGEIDVTNFTITPNAVQLGDVITMTARLASTSSETQQIVADYRIHYVRPNGKTAAKVFKLKTFTLAGRRDATLSIKQPIQDFSTRRHHPGCHEVELIINGQTAAKTAFDILSMSDH
ncbi:DNA alkylation repair protein [Pseudomonas sp. GX19020]|uniref:DNA alkylation repair protein n=1 Tax=Pseudomonas sp. GX19020 TaxID=2942277 RepID=UPI002018992D|nr:DNA alkylation repair protein [Pseudomonas sp. GX19020]MCL4068240.1 DNA alkylation repair protein [Pseudomonas sp. GX19020]